MATQLVTPPAKRGPGRPTNASKMAHVAPTPAPVVSNPPKPVGRPPAHAAPAMPLRPARVPVAPVAPGRPPANVPQQIAAIGPAVPPVDVAALRAEINGQKTEIQRLTSTIAKLTPRNIRTLDEILACGEAVDAADWRVAGGYHGAELKLNQFIRDVKTDAMTLTGRVSTVFCHVPTDDDVGGNGTLNRNQGLLACQTGKRVDGTFTGEPFYIYEDELATLWAEEES
jgi:hypothetical protein